MSCWSIVLVMCMWGGAAKPEAGAPVASLKEGSIHKLTWTPYVLDNQTVQIETKGKLGVDGPLVGTGWYRIDLEVGSNPQAWRSPASMIIDTGSSRSWVKRNWVIYTGLSGVTDMECTDTLCRYFDLDFSQHCDLYHSSAPCRFAINYADNSYVAGTSARADMKFAGDETNVPFTNIAFGMAIQLEHKALHLQDLDGLLGFDMGPASFVQQSGIRKFGYCLSGKSGALYIGDAANFDWINGQFIIYEVDLVNTIQDNRYYVFFRGVTIGDIFVSAPPGKIVQFDSGTTMVQFAQPYYGKVKNQIDKAFARYKQMFYSPTQGVCYLIPDSDPSWLEYGPRFDVNLMGATLKLEMGTYVRIEVEAGYFCLPFGLLPRGIATKFNIIGIIGNVMQNEHMVVHDLAELKLRISKAFCPRS